MKHYPEKNFFQFNGFVWWSVFCTGLQSCLGQMFRMSFTISFAQEDTFCKNILLPSLEKKRKIISILKSILSFPISFLKKTLAVRIYFNQLCSKLIFSYWLKNQYWVLQFPLLEKTLAVKIYCYQVCKKNSHLTQKPILSFPISVLKKTLDKRIYFNQVCGKIIFSYLFLPNHGFQAR